MTPTQHTSNTLTTFLTLSEEIDALRLTTRRMWDVESNRSVQRQDGLLLELVDLELELERLSLRATSGRCNSENVAWLSQCSERIRVIQSRVELLPTDQWSLGTPVGRVAS